MVRLVRHLRSLATRLATAGLNLLVPPRCACCHAELAPDHGGLMLCPDCQVLLGPEIWPGCGHCGAIGQADGGSPGRCALCRDVPLRFDKVIPLGGYQDALRDAVLRMKRLAYESLSGAMGTLAALRRGNELADLEADLIVPVPMYWTRRVKRGTNSPEIVAAALGQSLKIPVRPRALVRRRNTLPQADLPPRQRFHNVRGAFGVRAGHRLAKARVLLVDDILTTGATCSEAAAMLKQAGASMVAVAVITRAQGPYAT